MHVLFKLLCPLNFGYFEPMVYTVHVPCKGQARLKSHPLLYRDTWFGKNWSGIKHLLNGWRDKWRGQQPAQSNNTVHYGRNLSQVPLWLCFHAWSIGSSLWKGRDINVFIVTCGTCFLEGTICHWTELLNAL